MIAYLINMPSQDDVGVTNLRAFDINLTFSDNITEYDVNTINSFIYENPTRDDMEKLHEFCKDKYINISLDILFIGSGKREHLDHCIVLDAFSVSEYQQFVDGIRNYQSIHFKENVRGLEDIMKYLIEKRGIADKIGLDNDAVLFRNSRRFLKDRNFYYYDEIGE